MLHTLCVHYPTGLALRFVRVKRYGPDKTAADADTVQTVRSLYEKLIGLDASISRTGSLYLRCRRVQRSGFF